MLVFSHQSFHSFQPRTMSFKKMDPSCTIGFYCETKAEFEKFRQQTTEVSSVNKHYYPKQYTAFFMKKYSSTPPICWKFSRAFRIHLDPFTSGDDCCDQGYNLLPIYGTILQPYQNKAANNSKRHILMGSKSSAKLSTK